MKKVDFELAVPRPLPVIVMADTSGSMAVDGKMDLLNDAIRDMIVSFEKEDGESMEIHVAIVAFGGNGAVLHLPLQKAAKSTWRKMVPDGQTPMGQAFALVRAMFEEPDVIPVRSCHPCLVLVSDGEPTDEWQKPLAELLASERTAKAHRFALAIGEDANLEMLQEFLGEDCGRVFAANEAKEIRKFFQWVTVSVSVRSKGSVVDNFIEIDPENLDGFSF